MFSERRIDQASESDQSTPKVLSGDGKKTIPFRDGKIGGQPWMPQLRTIPAGVPGRKNPAAGSVQSCTNDRMQSQTPGGSTRDLRLEAANLLNALYEHDPHLDPFERSDIERVIGHLDAAREREKKSNLQTPILDLVIPTGCTHGSE